MKGSNPRILAALVMLFPAAIPGADEAKSVFWEPYRPDGQTVVLCHFDGERETGVDDLLGDDDALFGDGELVRAVDDGTGPSTVNDVYMKGASIPLLGDCRETANEGRFAGGLRLKGKDGRIAVKGKPGRGWTLEAWFKVARLPDGEATLVELPYGPMLRVLLQSDGRLGVNWLDTKEPALSDRRVATDNWFHLTLVWEPRSFHVDNVTRAEMRVLINGRPVARSGVQPADAFKRTLGQTVSVGNNAKGTSGLDGWIDELRLSSTARPFYTLDLGWVDADGGRPEPIGRPYVRDQQDLLFWLSFNDSLTPVRASGDVRLAEGTPADAASLREGRKGWGFDFGEGVAKQSLMLKPGQKSVRYDGVRVPGDQGSLAFWLRPRDWDNAKRWNQFADFKQEFAAVLHLEQGGEKVMAFTWVKTPNNDNYPNPVDFNPGRWVHMVLTWQDGKPSRVYLNGKAWSHWGTVQWHHDRDAWDAEKPVTLVLPAVENAIYLDDLRVYRRPLAPTEAANLAALYDKRAELKPLQDYDYVKNVNGVFGRATVKLWPLLKEYGRVHTATLSLSPAGNTEILGTARAEVMPDRPMDITVEAEPFDFGDYTLTVRSFDQQGTELNTFRIPHTRAKPPWWRSTVGLSDKVMPDWEPVRVRGRGRGASARGDGAVVGISVRDIHLAASGLPAKIVSVGEDILAGPIELIATVDGKETPLKPVADSFHAEARSEVRADFAGIATASGLTANIAGYVEFDGFMWFEVTVASNAVDRSRLQSSGVDSLRLTVPYAADAANLLHAWGGNSWFRDPRNVRIMEVPETPGTVFNSLDKSLIRTTNGLRGSFMPYALLTGDKRGMAWFAENDRGWTQSTETPALSIERLDNGHVVLTLNIISEPVDLAKPRTFAFGLHPIPVKPLDPAWRSWEWWTVAPGSFCGYNLKGDRTTQMWRHPIDLDWEAVKERFAGHWGKAGNHPRTVLVPGLYHDLRRMGGTAAPDAREWVGDWYGHGWGKGRDTLRYTRELVDYSAYYFNEWVRRGFCYGVYMDDVWNAPQKVVPGPAAYLLEDGHMQPGFEWRNQREYLKRIRQIFYDNGLTPHMCVHLTHTHYPMWLSFFDEMYDGEDHDLRRAGSPRDFMDFWTPFRLRFHNSQKWGIAPYFHNWIGNNMKDHMGKMPAWTFRQARAYAAALLVHDIGWLNRENFASALDKRDTWKGWVQPNILTQPDNVLVPYWAPKPAAPDAPDGLYVTAWRRKGWCAVAMANWGNERIEAEVRLDTAAMGFADLDPDTLAMRDVDSGLIRYFDDDVTQVKEPDQSRDDILTEDDDLGLGLEEPPSADERKATDPDAACEWQDGILRCPVRRHDFRLFEFRTAESGGTPADRSD